MEDRKGYSNNRKQDKFYENDWDRGLGKIPPQAVDLEEAILGAILLESDTFSVVNVELSAETFYKPVHEEIYRACLQLFNNSEPIDLLTVKNKLTENGKLEFCGGLGYIAELTQRVNSSANVQNWCVILREMHAKRQAINLSATIQKMAYDDTCDVFEIVDYLNESLSNVTDGLLVNQDTTIEKHFLNAFLAIEEARKNKGVLGVPSKFAEIQQALKGYRKGGLYILGARPSMGKSLWMINEAIYQCQAGFKVAIFTMEMSGEEQLFRLMSNISEVECNTIEAGSETPEQNDLIQKSLGRFPIKNLNIFDKSSMNVRYLKSCIQKLKRKKQIDIAFIDHLGLIKLNPKMNRNDGIGEVTAELKAFSKDLGVPIVLLCQLGRESAKRPDKEPQLSDLRDSGNIEQDASTCMFLHRAEYYDPETMPGLGEIFVRKNRGGALGKATFEYLPKISTMRELKSYQDFVTVTDAEVKQLDQSTHDYSTNKVFQEVGSNSFQNKEVPF